MKHSTLLSVLCLFCSNLFAQSWFEHNPRWSNLTWGLTGTNQEICFPSIDTMIGDRLAKTFEKDPANEFSRRRFAAQSGDTIFAWSRNPMHPIRKFFASSWS